MYNEEKSKLDKKRNRDIDIPVIKIPSGKVLNGKLPAFLRGK